MLAGSNITDGKACTTTDSDNSVDDRRICIDSKDKAEEEEEEVNEDYLKTVCWQHQTLTAEAVMCTNVPVHNAIGFAVGTTLPARQPSDGCTQAGFTTRTDACIQRST